MCLVGVWKLSNRCLEGIWIVSGLSERCLEGVWSVSGKCLEGVWMVTEWCMMGVWLLRTGKGRTSQGRRGQVKTG